MAKVFVVAELSSNHGHNLELALKSVCAAKKSGADAIKIQTYTADTLTLKCDEKDFRLGKGLWDGETYYSLYQKAVTPWEGIRKFST